MPVPASTVEEHSLHNISCASRPWFETRRGFLSFQTREFLRLALKFDGEFPTYGHVNQLRSLEFEKTVATNLLLYEEERSLENRSYDVIMSQSDVIYSTTQHYTNLATYDNNQLSYD